MSARGVVGVFGARVCAAPRRRLRKWRIRWCSWKRNFISTLHGVPHELVPRCYDDTLHSVPRDLVWRRAAGTLHGASRVLAWRRIDDTLHGVRRAFCLNNRQNGDTLARIGDIVAPIWPCSVVPVCVPVQKKKKTWNFEAILAPTGDPSAPNGIIWEPF